MAAIGDIAKWKYKMEKNSNSVYLIEAPHVRKVVVGSYNSSSFFSFPPHASSLVSWVGGLWGGGGREENN